MQKNYLFFETNLPQILHGIFQKNNAGGNSLFGKKALKHFFVLFFLITTHLGYSQIGVGTENFNSGIPGNWVVGGTLGGTPNTFTNNWAPNPTAGLLSSGVATVNPSLNNTSGSTAQYFLITSQITLTANTVKELKFFNKQGSFTNKGATYQVRISTTVQNDVTGFSTILQSWTETSINTVPTSYEERTVSLPTVTVDTPIYIAFVAVTNQTGTPTTSGDSWFIEDARIVTNCPPVTGVTVIPGANSAQINWNHVSATNFGVEVVAAGSGHGTTGTPVTGATTYTAPALTPNTSYDVWVLANCDSSTSSTWVGPINFTTSQVGLNCSGAIVIPSDVTTAPYILNSNLNAYFSATDYTEYTTIGSNCFPGDTYNEMLGNHLFFNYTPTTTGLIDISQTTNTASGGGGNNCYNTQTSVMVYSSCSDVGINCMAAILTTSSGTTVQIPNLYVEAGHTYVIVMSSPFQHSATNNAGICFTFTVSGASCPAPSPSGTTYANLTQTSADFSWSNSGNLVSTWQYLVLPASSGAPSGQTPTTTTTNLNNPATGLTADTSYNLYVRSICGSTIGSWAPAFAFRTPCNVSALPYHTAFTDGDATLNCWSQLNLNNDLQYFTFGPNAFSEPVAKIRTSAQTNDMLITPQFHFDGTPKRLRFKYNIYGNWGLIVDNPTGGPGSFEVKLSTTGAGAQNFDTSVIPLTSYTTAYNFIEKIVPLPILNGDVNIAWIVPPGALQTGNWLYLDDVYIEDLPSCSEPAYPVVTPGSLTSTSVNISWTAGYQNTQWQLVAQPLGTGTPTDLSAPGTVVNIVSTNPYTITGLTPSTRYEFYMRAYCSASDQSIWVGPIYFNTVCIEQPTPYYESFNDVDPNSKKFCWVSNNANGDNAEWIINGTEAMIQPQPLTFFDPFVSYNDWLISVPVNAVGAKRVRFNYRITAPAGPIPLFPRGNFEVLLSSTPDFATYTTLIPLHDFDNQGFLEDSALFTGTGTTYIAFRMPPNMPDPTNTGRVIIDDFVIEDAPACPNPSHLDITATTTTTANLSWTTGDAETQWQIVVQEQGTGAPIASGTTVNTTPAYNATGLTQDTAYEYYVRAVCNATESSEWVGPFLFRTPCNPLPTPFLETFDSNSGTESCWTIYNVNADGNSWNLNQPVNPMFGDQMGALFTGSNGANNDYLITPTLTAHAGQRLRFFYKTLYGGDFEEDLKVIISTGGTALSQFTPANIIYENNLVIPTNATGTVAGSNLLTLTSNTNILLGDRVDIPGWVVPYGSTVTAINGNVITISGNADVTAAGPLNVTFSHEIINNTVTKEKVINLTGITSDTNINIAFHTPFFPPNAWNYRGQFTFIDNVIVEDIPTCPPVINITTGTIADTTAQINWQSTGSETSWEISVQPYGTAAPVGNTLPAYLRTTSTHPYTITGLNPSARYEYYVRALCSGSSQSTWVGPFEFTTRCDLANVCEYTISVTNGNTGQVTDNVTVIQNGAVVQALEFPGFSDPTTLDYSVFLCTGLQFSLYWNGFGSGLQYYEAQITIKDQEGNVVWTSPLGLGTVNTTLYTGVASCGVVTCPQPTNLTVSNEEVLSWTPGGSETAWEVFIQPLNNGTLPQADSVTHIVNLPNYTPVPADFMDASAGTYEYLVRAVCSPTSKSYWSGPKVFIRNDEPTTAVHLTPNTGSTCEVSGVDASFIGATASATPTTCGGINGGDIWYDFVATSRVHNIELSDIGPGSYYNSSYNGTWPKIMMSLYEVQNDGSLVEKGCSDNNSFTTTYSSELIVGKTYKIRLKLNHIVPNDKRFHICITTPSDLCNLDAFNYDLEKLPMQNVTGVSTIIDAVVVPGWRVNTDWGTIFFQEGSNSMDVTPYSGGQCVQLTQDPAADWNPTDPNIKGFYKDMDTSEITVMDFSFASATRQISGAGTTIQLFAGPPTGPFTVIAEDSANSLVWDLIEGSYTVPSGQTKTRFIFRVVGNAIGHILDAANFKPHVDIYTTATALDCAETTLPVSAEGVGQWEADAANPATTVIADPTQKATTISGITTPGSYTYHWKTRYCDKTVTITKQGTTDVATVTSPVTLCQNQATTALTATPPSGDTLMWYTQSTGGTGTTTAPTPVTTTAGNTSYFVSAVEAGGCEGARTEIVVTVNALPTATISGTTSICSGGTATITFNGTPGATVTYTVDNGSNQTITLNGSGTATVTTPALTVNSTYTLVSVTANGILPCSQALTGSAIITVGVLPTATISGTTTICSGGTATITFNGTANATVTYTVDSGSNQTITLNASGTATITTPALTVNSTYALVSVSIGSASCSQAQTGSAVVTVNTSPTAAISGTTTICSGGTASITFTGTANATVTYTVDSGSNQTVTLNGSGTASVTTPVLTTSSTYALVSVISGSSTCTQALTGSAIVTVTTLPTATISGTTTICSGGTATITFNGTANATVTYTVDSGSNQTILLNGSGTASVTTPVLTGNSTYTLVSVALATCSQVQTGSAVVTVNTLPTATISGTTTICSGGTTTITFNGTANAVVTYTINSGSNQTITLNGSGSATITTPVLTADSTYTLVSVTSAGTPACSQSQTGSAVVTVISMPIATISGTSSICTGATAVITFTGTANATVTYTVDSGSNQTIVLDAAGTATLTTPVLTLNSTYTLVSVAIGTSGCSQTLSGSAVITVGTLPTVTISGTTTICSGGTATITFNGTANATVTYTVDSGSNQTIVLNGSGSATITTPILTADSTYALVSVSNGTVACSQAQTGSAVITVNALPTATILGTTTICSGGTATITFNGTANATVTYTINSGSNQTIALNGSGTATVTTPVLTADSTYALVNVTASGTLACSQAQTGSAIVTVNTLPTVTILGTTSICNGGTATITFNGTANATVIYTVDSGSNQTITLNGSGTATITTPALTTDSTYTLVSVTSAGATPCSQLQTGSAVITVGVLPTATISGTTTICAGNTAVITFNGTQGATVTYTVDGGFNQTIVLDAAGTATVTTPIVTTSSTYTLVSVASGTSTCSQLQTGSAVVTVNTLPTATISGTTAICTGTTTVITFNGTANATVTYTVNGGGNQTIVLNGTGVATITTPALTTATTYTLVNVTSGTTTCSQSLSGSAVVTVNTLAVPNVTFTYDATCLNGASPLPTLPGNFTAGGVFSSTEVTVNATTGAVALTVPAGTYHVTYTLAQNTAACTDSGTYTTTIVLMTGFTPETGFSYDATYCANSDNALPVKATGFYAGGTFSSTAGLDINGTTGEINIAGSTPGTYTITYTVLPTSANCNLGGSDTWEITISASLDFTVADVCQSQLLYLQVTPNGSSFDGAVANYTWSYVTATIGTNASTFNVDEYLTQNPSLNLPLTFSVAVELDGCTYTKDFEVTDNPCKMIPKGISPNNDQMNDTFDLSGMGVTELEIFNRYGTKVYSFSGNYTNQWGGDSDSGSDLPDGTYFYVIQKSNGNKVTGWVYINRQY